MSPLPVTLVCFAVKEEALPFRKQAGSCSEVRVLLTGMGARNAEQAIRSELSSARPGLVLTCGLAGGLKPGLPTGTVVFNAEGAADLEPALLAAGAQRARFLNLDHVASTAEEKRSLRHRTGADAVEMESQVIAAVCREQSIPCATIRVILDTAEEDLEPDFNRLRTPDWQLDARKLTLLLLRSPSTMGALLRLRKQTRLAAENLADVLSAVVRNRAAQ